jgi:hypothetical protein
MAKKVTTHKVAHRKPREQFVQEVFVATVLMAWAAGIIVHLYQLMDVFSRNPNVSAFYTAGLYEIILPMIMFSGVWFLHKRASLWVRFLDSVTLSVAGVLFAGAVSRLCSFIINDASVVYQDPLTWWYLELVAAFASLIAFFAVLIVARRNGHWV